MPERRSHYLKVTDNLKGWVPGGAGDGWQQELFDDATFRGTKLVVERLPPNEKGVRAAVRGERYYFEVGRDRERSDSLFVMRVERAEHRPRLESAITYHRTLMRWRGIDSPHRDDAGDIFGVAPVIDTSGTPAPPPGPSRRLSLLLAGAAAELRAHFQPTEVEPTLPTPAEVLESMRRAWTSHRVDQHMAVTDRQERLLKGLIRPKELGGKERRALLRLFGFEFLNARSTVAELEIPQILESLLELPLTSEFRLTVWACMTAGLGTMDMRRELHACAAALRRVALSELDVDELRHTVAALLDGATRTGDDRLVELLRSEAGPAEALVAVAQWAEGLEFASDDERADEERSEPTTALAPTPHELSAVPEAFEEPPAHLTPSSNDLERDAVEAWLLRQLLPDRANAERQLEAGRAQLRLLASEGTLLTSLDDIAWWQQSLRDLRTLADRSATHLPIDIVRAKSELVEARELFERARRVLGDAANALLEGAVLSSPQELEQVVTVLEHDDVIRHAPSWVWTSDDEEGETFVRDLSDGPALVRYLLRPTCRRLLTEICRMVGRLGHPAAARLIPPLEPGHDPFELLERWQEQLTRFLAEGAIGLTELLARGASMEEVEEEQHLFSALTSKLVAATLDGVRTELAEIATSTERIAYLRAVASAVARLEDEDVLPEEIGFGTLRRRTYRHGGMPDSLRGQDMLRIEHNMVDHPVRHAHVVFSQPDTSVEYGIIAVPLVVVATRARELKVRLEWTVRHDARGWPSEWPVPEPAAPFLITPIDWHEHDRNIFHFPFSATFPLRTPLRRHGGVKLEVSGKAFDAITGAPLSEATPLSWDNVGMTIPRMELQLKDEANPAYVDSHPIGPQTQAADILSRLAAGSVAVIAPRRFGKSTLVEYLVAHGQSRGLLIPPDLRCTNYATNAGFDFDGLWRDVSERLQQSLGNSASTRLADGLPAEDAFDHVRRAAKAKGHAAVVLLFDEAQLFFPRHDSRVASKLKTLLERHWHRSDDPNMVPLRMGFIGLPSMRTRAGNDLMALLRPVARDRMTEEELRPLIRSAGGGLQTTRTARRHLAHVSGNLFILRVMLDRLIERARRESRVWVSYRDAVEVEYTLRKELKAGQAPELESYIRDALNEGERVENWEPIPAFPTAVAAATTAAPATTTSIDALVQRITDQLNRWCRAQATSTTVMQYDEELVTTHLDTLRERRVIVDGTFASHLLEDWLAGMASRATNEAFRQALFRGAHHRIVIPEGAEHITTGGQATIRRADVRGTTMAYRSRRLANNDDREVFLQSSEILHVVRNLVDERAPGSDYLFEIKELGLSAKDAQEAIQVYRWVEGDDLSAQEGRLSTDMVVDIGTKLASALVLIHDRDVLHRDICPRNIVLNRTAGTDSVRPVLIDFGFARTAASAMGSLIAGEHIAPECRNKPPKWGKPADVYALSWTLNWLLDPTDGSSQLGHLRQAIGVGAHSDASKRSTAGEMLALLREVETASHITDKRSRAWAGLEATVSPQERSDWFLSNLTNSKSALLDVHLGFIKTSTFTYSEIALFLQKTIESYSRGHKSLLNLFDRAGLSPDEKRAVRYLHALRNMKGHATEAIRFELREVIADFESLETSQQRSFFLTGTKAVAKYCSSKSLVTLVEKVLGN